MVSETFPEDLVAVSVGGLTLAKEFPTLRWDHLLYTGSPAIGREVALAAADNLVPVTLELGGKCPAILAADSVDAEQRPQRHRHQADQERPDVHLGRLRARPARPGRRLRCARAESYAANELADYTASGDCTGHHHRSATSSASRQCWTRRGASGARMVSLGGEG